MQRCNSCGEYEMEMVECGHRVCRNCDNGLCGGPCTTGEFVTFSASVADADAFFAAIL